MDAATSREALPLYSKIFLFEIPFFLYQFAENFYRLLYQQYYFQYFASQTIKDANFTPRSHCLTQDDIVNYTGNRTFLHMQDDVNKLNMYTEILFLGLSAITALLFGPLSDIIGRKPIIIISFLGLTFTAILQLVIFQFNLNVNYYLLCAVLFGASGGFGTVMTLMMAAVHDITPEWLYTIRLGLLESCIAIAKATTSLGTNNWIQRTGCDFRPPAWLMIVVTAVAIISVVMMPETLPKEIRQQNKSQDYKGLSKLINGFKIFIMPKFVGLKNYWQLLTATAVISLASVGLGAYNTIMNYFLHNKPLEWSYDRIGMFGAIYSAAMGISLIVVLPILIAITLSNYIICLIGALVAVITNILIAVKILSDWEMFTVGAFQGLLILAYPTMRSCITNLVGPEQQGSVFSIAIAIQITASIMSTIITNEIYQPQIGQTKDAGDVFWVMGGAWFITLPLILLLQCKGNRVKPTNQICRHFHSKRSKNLHVNEKSYGSIAAQ